MAESTCVEDTARIGDRMAENATPATPAGWVTLPGGGIVPASMDRATGWGGDRDSVNTAEVTEARRAVALAVTEYRRASARLYTEQADMVADLIIAIGKADTMAEAWDRFAEVTGGAE